MGRNDRCTDRRDGEQENENTTEETKRLLYVALTRARDRLYLSGSISKGMFRPTRGALAEVMPESVRVLFARAAAGAGPIEWTGERAVHTLVVPDALGEREGPLR